MLLMREVYGVNVVYAHKRRERDIQDEEKHAIPHEKLHVLVGLPPSRCLVHVNRLPQGSGNGKNQKLDTENGYGERSKWEKAR